MSWIKRLDFCFLARFFSRCGGDPFHKFELGCRKGCGKEIEKRVAFDNKRPLWQCGPCGGIPYLQQVRKGEVGK